MYRPAIRALPRAAPRALLPTPVRFASSTAAPKGTWKGTALRWGVAVGALYWYNTSPLLQEDSNATKTVPPPPQFSDDDAPTVEAVVAQKRKQAEAKALARQKASEQEHEAKSNDGSSNTAAAEGEDEMGDLEEEAGRQAAFDPETGEINWDCPCLGGMAHGPCGEEFKAAFSCFVYSEEEPKGINCIDKFQGMQDCFRKYPEHYASELADDEDPDLSPEQEPAPQQPVEDTSDMPKEGAPAPKSDPAPEASNPSTLKHPEKSVEDAVDELAQSQEQLPPKPQKARDPMRDAS